MVERLARALGLAAALVAVSAGAADDTTEHARRLFQTGRELYQQARYREAIAEFERAYALKPHGAIQFNIAQCFEKLGDLSSAIESYKRYLAEVPKAEDRATVLLVIGNLEQRQRESTPQRLTVRSAPAGATVAVDGEPRGTTPLDLEVKPGRHALELSLPKYLTATREVSTGWEKPTEVDIILELAPPAPTIWNRPRLWTWVALGSAAAIGATGAYFGYQSMRADEELRNPPDQDPTRPRSVVDPLHQRAIRSAVIANILFGGAALVGAGGVTLFFFEGRL